MSNRVEWIDMLKGFLLILVCIGHIHINCQTIEIFLNICLAFTLVTFFFLSGLLFKCRNFITSKTKHLLLPYITLSCFFFIIDFTEIKDKNSIIQTLLNIFLYGGTASAAPLWFVYVLYIDCILYYFIHSIFNGKRIPIFIYAVIMLLLGWYYNMIKIEIPFKLNTVCTTSFFFPLGFLCKNYILPLTEKKAQEIILTIILTLFLYIYSINKNGNIILWNNSLGTNFVYFILSTITGIYLIINIFILFSKSRNKFSLIIKGILKNIARNALIILAVHYWAIRCCNIFLHTYKNEQWYSYLVLAIVISSNILAIPLFRNKLYWLIGKDKISLKESLSIK